ncbi:MAG: diguanylate cyclase [Thermoanaerobaculia bacterium]
MKILGIDHINISGPRTLIDECRAFYVDILGLQDGPRPPFRTPGFWLYAGDRAIVHLSEKIRETTARTDTAFDHCAMSCSGLESAKQRLQDHAVPYTLKQVPGSGDAQIFLQDPGGLTLELNFRGGE